MPQAELRRRADNILLCNYLDADSHDEHWRGHKQILYTIAGNTVGQRVSVMEYYLTLGLVFATDDPVNTENRMDNFFYEINTENRFIYKDPQGDTMFVECISEWPETETRTYGEVTEWIVKAQFKMEGFIP